MRGKGYQLKESAISLWLEKKAGKSGDEAAEGTLLRQIACEPCPPALSPFLPSPTVHLLLGHTSVSCIQMPLRPQEEGQALSKWQATAERLGFVR